MKCRDKIFVTVLILLVVGMIVAMLNANDANPSNSLRAKKSVLRSSLAGTWYTEDAKTLKAQLQGFLQEADTEPLSDVKALILPHAGYQYSGRTAARAVKALGRTYKRIVVLGPSHSVSMPDQLSVPQVSHYETPIGQVPLDRAFIERLLEHRSMFKSKPFAHQGEHSVQIELPLLQMQQSDFQFVPIVVGQCSLPAIERAAAVLKGLMDDQTLLVVSTDFTHYGHRFGYVPFDQDIPAQLEKLDMGAYQAIEAKDARAFVQYQEETGATICGRVPVAILLAMLDAPCRVQRIEYTTSGALTGDFNNSVSYLSAVVRGTWPAAAPVEPLAEAGAGLSKSDQSTLLKLARETICFYLKHKEKPEPGDLGVEIGPDLQTQRAAFVTLKKGERLRGCIGDIIPRVPLYQSVINNAVNAAVNDYRFEPVTEAECEHLRIEISALTVPEQVGTAQDIRIGTDGVILQKDQKSAVFLPQVAPEQGWTLEQTLSHLAQKAGLNADAWRQGASFFVFQAEVFGEAT